MRAALRRRRAARPVPRPQAARCTSWRSEPAGTACTRALGITKPFYDRFVPGDLGDATSRCATAPLDRALDFLAVLPVRDAPRRRPRRAGASCSTRTCPTSRASAPGRSARSGCGRRWPACTCRCSTCCDGAAGDASASRPCCATSSRRCAARRASASSRFLRDIRAPIHAEDAAGLDATGEPELAAEVRRAAGDYTRADEAFERARRRPARRLRAASTGVELWTSRRHPRGAAAAGHRRRPCGCSSATGIGLAPARASAAGAAASGCPSAPTRPGLERELADHGVRALLRRPDRASRLGSLDQLEPGRHRRRPGGGADRLGDGRAGLGRRDGYPGAPRLPRLPRAAPSTTCKPWNNGGRPYDHDAALALAPASTRATSCERAGGSTPTGPSAAGRAAVLRARHRAARPLVVRGAGWLAAVLEEAPAQGARAGHAVREALERVEPGRARRSRPSTWGTGKDLTHVGLARGGRAGVRRPRGRAAHRGGRRGARRARAPALERAARELLALQASDWAFMVTRDAGRPTIPRERVRRPRWPRWTPRSRALTDSARRAGSPIRARPGARPRPGSPLARLRSPPMRVLILSWEYPPLIEGGLARHVRKLVGEPGRAGRRRARAHPRARGVAGRGGRRRRDRPPGARARAPARAGRVRRLDRAHELGHAGRGRGAGRPLRLRRRARARLAGGRRPATTSPSASARRSW